MSEGVPMTLQGVNPALPPVPVLPQGLRKVVARLTATAAGDYGAGDVVSNSATDTAGVAVELPNIARKAGDVVTVFRVYAICDEDSITTRLRLHFFDQAPLAAEVEMDDNAPFTLTTLAGAEKSRGYIDLPAFADKGAFSEAQANQLQEDFACHPFSTTLFFVVESLDAEANETAGMKLRFEFYVG